MVTDSNGAIETLYHLYKIVHKTQDRSGKIGKKLFEQVIKGEGLSVKQKKRGLEELQRAWDYMIFFPK